jgi:hypothetical protein
LEIAASVSPISPAISRVERGCWVSSWRTCSRVGSPAERSSEVQHLFAALPVRPADDLGHRLRWSWWRRRHQARARACHYGRQANGP